MKNNKNYLYSAVIFVATQQQETKTIDSCNTYEKSFSFSMYLILFSAAAIFSVILYLSMANNRFTENLPDTSSVVQNSNNSLTDTVSENSSSSLINSVISSVNNSINNNNSDRSNSSVTSSEESSNFDDFEALPSDNLEVFLEYMRQNPEQFFEKIEKVMLWLNLDPNLDYASFDGQKATKLFDLLSSKTTLIYYGVEEYNDVITTINDLFLCKDFLQLLDILYEFCLYL